ncbi:MAG: ribonuclease HII, partial [Nitrososphaerota archaeon]|nr:ribonuclease HII [Nitrososphaerota archaeon]
MSGRTWRIQEENAEKVKEYLLAQGGIEERVKGAHEEWRIKFSDSTFTYYKSGTLYSTPSRSLDPVVEDTWKFIDSIVGRYVAPSKDFLIGLDETGKGEIIGHTVLAGIIFPKEIYHELDRIVG